MHTHILKNTMSIKKKTKFEFTSVPTYHYPVHVKAISAFQPMSLFRMLAATVSLVRRLRRYGRIAFCLGVVISK